MGKYAIIQPKILKYLEKFECKWSYIDSKIKKRNLNLKKDLDEAGLRREPIFPLKTRVVTFKLWSLHQQYLYGLEIC